MSVGTSLSSSRIPAIPGSSGATAWANSPTTADQESRGQLLSKSSEDLEERRERHRPDTDVQAAADQPPGTRGDGGGASRLVNEPRLPDPRLTDDDDRATPLGRPIDQPGQDRELQFATDEDRTRDPRHPARASVHQSVTRRRMVTAFWPPKPKPSTATVSTLASRFTSGT